MSSRKRRPQNMSLSDWVNANKVKQSDGCEIWPRSTNQYGYGQLFMAGKAKYVHRIAWEATFGPIPAGQVVDHICHNPRCVRVNHLRLATRRENQQNRAGAARHSKSGIRGVSWSTAKKRWAVYVGHLGKSHFGGYFRDIESAERAAIELRLSLHENPSLSDLAMAGVPL